MGIWLYDIICWYDGDTSECCQCELPKMFSTLLPVLESPEWPGDVFIVFAPWSAPTPIADRCRQCRQGTTVWRAAWTPRMWWPWIERKKCSQSCHERDLRCRWCRWIECEYVMSWKVIIPLEYVIFVYLHILYFYLHISSLYICVLDPNLPTSLIRIRYSDKYIHNLKHTYVYPDALTWDISNRREKSMLWYRPKNKH